MNVPISKNMVRNTTESKYVVVSPCMPRIGLWLAARARSAIDAPYATVVPAEMRRFMDPNRTKRCRSGVRLPGRQSAHISRSARR
jgi:hypothetical protein